MLFTDVATIEGSPRITRDGYLVASCRAAKGGNIQLYQGAELGRPDLGAVRVWRPEEQVFDPASMASYAHRPVCLDHPAKHVNSKSWSKLSVGTIGDEIVRDGSFIRVPLCLMDQAAIDQVSGGKRALSMGYSCKLDWKSGSCGAGEYDAVQSNIIANHIAIVDTARAGPEARIGDSWVSDDPVSLSPPTITRNRDMPDMALRTVPVDGVSIQSTEQGAQVIERQQRQLADALANSTSLTAQHTADMTALRTEHTRATASLDSQIVAIRAEQGRAIEAKDGEIAGLKAGYASEIEAKDGEIAALKAQIPDAAAIDNLIARRSAIISVARKFLGNFDPTGKTDDDIRRACVMKKLGDKAPAVMAPEYVSAAFDTMDLLTPAPAGADPIRDAMRTSQARGGTDFQSLANDATSARLASVRRLEDAWKTAGAPS